MKCSRDCLWVLDLLYQLVSTSAAVEVNVISERFNLRFALPFSTPKILKRKSRRAIQLIFHSPKNTYIAYYIHSISTNDYCDFFSLVSGRYAR